MATANTISIEHDAIIDTSSIIKQIKKIQAMVICARVTIDSTADTDAQAAATLLMEADNRIYDLKLAIDPHYSEADEGVAA